MNKEYLEALEKLGRYALYESYNELQVNETDEFDIVQQALLKLKAIKEAESSEALKCLEYLDETCGCFALDKEYEAVNTIEQYILKAQEQDKVLEIIKEKEVDVHLLKTCITCYIDSLNAYNSEIKKIYSNHKDYQNKHLSFYLLTQEEFDILKEALKCQD